jgi:hypothetical protein
LHPSIRPLLALTLAFAVAPSCGRTDQETAASGKQEVAESALAETKTNPSGKLFEEIAAPMEFRDPDPGPRAPEAAAFGVEIGRASYADVMAYVEAKGFTCKDTSIRAMMEAKREAEKEKQATKGEDAVSSASWMNKKSKREKNPQVRFSCPSVDSDAISDRERVKSQGRLLFVFDNDDLPLRHVSYQRSHDNHTAALDDYEDSVKAMTARFGEPTATRGELPERDAKGKAVFPPSRSLEIRWDFSDLAIKVTAIHFGRKVTVGERIEVPHGIRPDAPALGRPEPTVKPIEAAPAVPVGVPTEVAPTKAAPKPAPSKAPEPKMSAKDAKELEAKKAADAADEPPAAR